MLSQFSWKTETGNGSGIFTGDLNIYASGFLINAKFSKWKFM